MPQDPIIYPATMNTGFMLQPRTQILAVPFADEKTYRKAVSDFEEERMAWKQRYAESTFNDWAVSDKDARGPYQIRPIAYKDYLLRGKGKPGNLFDPAYARKVRDFNLKIVSRDLGETWSKDSDSVINLAKRYAGYNMGGNALKNYLLSQQKKGIDIFNSLDWIDNLPKEARNYVNYLVLNQDVDEHLSEKGYRDAWAKRFTDKFPEDRHLPAAQEVSLPYTYAAGGDIHIDPSKKGTFKAAAKRHGKSVQAFASQVLANKGNYSPAMVRKANFARNAAKWHAEGGILDRMTKLYEGNTSQMLDLVRSIRVKK